MWAGGHSVLVVGGLPAEVIDLRRETHHLLLARLQLGHRHHLRQTSPQLRQVRLRLHPTETEWERTWRIQWMRRPNEASRTKPD